GDRLRVSGLNPAGAEASSQASADRAPPASSGGAAPAPLASARRPSILRRLPTSAIAPAEPRSAGSDRTRAPARPPRPSAAGRRASLRERLSGLASLALLAAACSAPSRHAAATTPAPRAPAASRTEAEAPARSRPAPIEAGAE